MSALTAAARPRNVSKLLRDAVRLDFVRPFCAPVVQRRDGSQAPVNKLRGFIVRCSLLPMHARGASQPPSPRAACRALLNLVGTLQRTRRINI